MGVSFRFRLCVHSQQRTRPRSLVNMAVVMSIMTMTVAMPVRGDFWLGRLGGMDMGMTVMPVAVVRRRGRFRRR